MQGKFSENYVQSIVALLNSNDEHLRAGAAYAIAYIVDDNCTSLYIQQHNTRANGVCS